MAKPWEKNYSVAASEPSESDLDQGPWSKFAQRTPPAVNNLLPTEQPPAEEQEPGMLSSVLHSAPVEYGLKALDYPGGIVRTALAGGAGLLTGDQPVDEDDLVNTLKGQAPSSAEYMQRLGVSEGPSMQVPFTDNKRISLRDAEGFAMDVVTDPLTLISKSVKALRPAGVAAEKAGASVYKSGLKKIDEKLVEKGAGPVSDVLLKEGKVGTTKKLAKEADEIGKKALAERATLYKKAAEKGVTIDMGFPLEQAEKHLKKMASDPGLALQMQPYVDLMESYKKAGKVDIGTLSDWKTNLYNALPATAFDGPKLKSHAAEFKKALSNDFKNAIVGAGNKAEKGLGDKIDKLNETMQSVIEARKPMKMQVRRANTPNAITAVDSMLAAAGGTIGGIPGAALAVGGKKAVQGANTTLGRTAAGKGLIEMGKSGVPDALIRQGMIDAQRRKRKGLIHQDGLLIPVSEGYEQ